MDAALAEIVASGRARDVIAVVAIGGYGRGELSPWSDIDLLLLTPNPEADHAAVKSFLYPLWDAALRVGHAVVTPATALERAGGDLHAATALLTARLVAGRSDLFDELTDRRRGWLRRESRVLVRRIAAGFDERRSRAMRAGWALAPDLKEDVGGLRDAHAVQWVQIVAGHPELQRVRLDDSTDVLLAARDALHREVQREVDRLRIDLQPKVAQRLGINGDAGADDLMIEVHDAARTIERESARLLYELGERVTTGPRRSGSATFPAEGVRLSDGFVEIASHTDLSPVLAVRAAAVVASTTRPLRPRSYELVEKCFWGTAGLEWDADLREAFFDLLDAPGVARGLEMLDGAGAWNVLLPEWNNIRCRAQHDPYHRLTVDAHSFAAVEEARRAGDSAGPGAALTADDRRVLLLAALLHDIGKGSGIDHSVAGEALARGACNRMGLPKEMVGEVCALVRWHLLLPDTATRRDLEDGAVIETVARTVQTPRRARLLYALSAADGRATGPAAWSSWKAALVAELYRKLVVALETGEVPVRRSIAERAREVEAYEPGLAGRAEQVLACLPPSYGSTTSVPEMADELHLLLAAPAPGQARVRLEQGLEAGQWVVTLCVSDRPGALAKTAGVLALRRLSVLSARAYSTSNGLALQRFIVQAAAEDATSGLEETLEAAYAGRLAVDARVRQKVRDYGWNAGLTAEVRMLHDSSEHSTIVEVRAPDALGLLYAVTAALADLELDIHVAKIDTLSERVVDVFYVRSPDGAKLDDQQATEAKRAIEDRLHRFFSG